MGVKTQITLDELNTLFPVYNFTKITPTNSGIMDTTYIVFTKSCGYILKKYERDISSEIEADKILLAKLKTFKLNVPIFIAENQGWYLYEKLQGSQPKSIRIYHIQALGRFLAKLHTNTYKKQCNADFMNSYKIKKLLYFTKHKFFSIYKKLQFLESFEMKNDGFIHGDLFKDNTVFDGEKIGVFDFIDSGCGSFSFDCAVGLVGFSKTDTLSQNIFINTYNQHAPIKLTKKELKMQIKIASGFYALLRINHYNSIKKAKKMMIF